MKELQCHYILRLERLVWSVFYFEKNSAALEHFQCVPLPFFDVCSVDSLLGVNLGYSGNGAILVVEYYVHTSAHKYVCLCGVAVSVYGQLCAGLKSVEESLRLCIEAFVQVVIHSRAAHSSCQLPSVKKP